MSTHAVMVTGGKQYLVTPGESVEVEKLPGEAGEKIAFDQVLLAFTDASDVRVGAPTVQGATVTGTIVRQARAKKVTVIKYRAKSRYRRKLGHRQHFTEVKIETIA